MNFIDAGKIFVFAVISSTLLLISGCASGIGTKRITDPELISQVEPNKSTKADVRELFGPPTKTRFQDDGDEVWDYRYQRSQTRATTFVPYVNMVAGGADMKMATLTVLFDENGVVKKIGAGSRKGGGGGIQDLGR